MAQHICISNGLFLASLLCALLILHRKQYIIRLICIPDLFFSVALRLIFSKYEKGFVFVSKNQYAMTNNDLYLFMAAIRLCQIANQSQR